MLRIKFIQEDKLQKDTHTNMDTHIHENLPNKRIL